MGAGMPEPARSLEQQIRSTKGMERRPIDLVHLAKQTLGDPGLEAEVLIMFESLSRTYLERLKDAQGREALAHALHALKGASAGVGANTIRDLARQAEAELAKVGAVTPETIADISMAVEEVAGFIARLLHHDQAATAS